MEEKYSLIENLLAIERFIGNPRQTPKPLLESLTKHLFHGKCNFLDLLDIGGESIVLRLHDPDNGFIVAKVARANTQQQYSSTPTGMQVVNIANKRGKPKPTNTGYERFYEGAKLQREIFNRMMVDKITFFAIPQVLYLSSSPLFFTMPYVETPSLLRYLKDARKGILDILNIFQRILEAIKYVHSKSIVHRDLKIDNLFIGYDFLSVIIGDWTLSKPIGNRNLTLPGTQGGTPFIAPRKFIKDRNFKDANFRDDIYCLGYTLAEMLMCKNVFSFIQSAGDKEEEIRRKIVEYLPDIIQGIFWKATEEKESDRYQNIPEFSESIGEAIQWLGTRNVVTMVSDEVSNKIDAEIQEIIIDSKIDVNDTDIYECENCGKCNGSFPCKKFRKSIIDIVLEMKKKGMI